jgi:hypothetical protein
VVVVRLEAPTIRERVLGKAQGRGGVFRIGLTFIKSGNLR